jgi:peptidoglycan/xylan/chitin deacetylase (PgdA/CDA1 family)
MSLKMCLVMSLAVMAASAVCGQPVPEVSNVRVARKGNSSVDTEPLKVTLTFDDNLRDHLLIAAPELEKRGWRGLFAIVTDWVDGADKYRLTWDDIRELKRRGHIIANHSKSHDLKRGGLGGLARLGLLDTVRSEIALASDVMEKELGERPRYLCLPGTSYTDEVGKIAAELGIKPMLVRRVCFGGGREDVAGCIRMMREKKRDRVDFLVHGVCREGKGWMAFKTKDDFIEYLDKVKAAENAGLIKVVDYDSL